MIVPYVVLENTIFLLKYCHIIDLYQCLITCFCNFLQSKKALDSAKAEFESQNKTLMTDMPKLYSGRIDYFEPSFQALIKSQVNHN